MKDHVEIGKELDLFCQSPVVGQGLPLMTPRGATVLRVLKRFIEDEEAARGYESTATPFMAQAALYQISGHWELYRENMFVIPAKEADGEPLALRPMTCPFQFQIYKRRLHSYRELPVRYAETSTLFRNEASGALHGLVRIRQFTLSEGHIICRPDQVEAEFLGALELVRFVMRAIGIDEFWFRFSRRGPAGQGKFIDDPEAWASSEATLRAILEGCGTPFVEAEGEAAFYGPKLDIQARDAWGRDETLFTLQLDFALPERFGMSYVDADGQEKRPMVIHRSSIGCYERTLALLLEKYQGRLPFWMAPEQVRIITMGEAAAPAALRLQSALRSAGIRAGIDGRNETLGRRIREAVALAVPVAAIIGEREAAAGTVSLRLADGRQKEGMAEADCVGWCRAAAEERSLAPGLD